MEEKKEELFPEICKWSCLKCEEWDTTYISLCSVRLYPAAVLLLGIWQEIQVKILWTWIRKEKEKKANHLEKRMMQFSRLGWRSKKRVQDSLAPNQVERVHKPVYHHSSVGVNTWENQKVRLYTPLWEKRWQCHLFAAWIYLIKMNKGGCWKNFFSQ